MAINGMRVWLVTAAIFTGSVSQVLCAADTSSSQNQSHSEGRALRRSPVVEVFENARDAVVNISSKEIVTVRDPFGFSMFDEFFDLPQRSPFGERQVTRTSVGSGFVIHPDGYIVTNAHVVAQTAERKAIFSDGREFQAEVVAFDTARDLAVLKIEVDPATGPLHTIHLGRSDDLMIGETVIAIGNPLGFQNTVTAGVVSAVNRNLEFGQGKSLTSLIQTDASINPGNSGGPLLNVLGELIGINSAIRGDAQNIGFAIPVDQLREVLPELLDIERRYRVVCGLKVDTLNSPKVTAVQPGTPAEKAGLKIGDVIERIDGKPIREGIDFSIAMIGSRPGQTINLDVQRDGKPISTKLVLQARPEPDGAKLAWEKLGLEVQAMPAPAAEALGLSGARGVIVARVDPSGPADRTGIAARDVLVAIGRHAVDSTDDLGQLLEMIRSGESVPVTVLRVDRRTKLRMSGELQAR